jgi:PiT family inorganic phosphate transporter
MHITAAGDMVTSGTGLFLVLAIGMALSFEFVNGFHDTANAVATVIYTRTLRPWAAVLWSGCWNLIGVLCSSGGVAFAVLALLPAEMMLNVGSAAGFAMVFALLISAIIWNLGTWYLGLPASSSHTLIGAIMGVGLANSILMGGHQFGQGVNWDKAREVFLSLLISPIIGFVFAGLLLVVSKVFIRKPELYKALPKDQVPPIWIRGVLMLTCTGVSFAHGSNDGQKGMGLILLILIGILPGSFALNMHTDAAAMRKLQTTTLAVEKSLDGLAAAGNVAASEAPAVLSKYLKSGGTYDENTIAALAATTRQIGDSIAGRQSLSELSPGQRTELRTEIYLASETIGKLLKENRIADPSQRDVLAAYKSGDLDPVTKFIPIWVKIATALALGVGTMIGWKRIVTTVGEKIGKEHLSCAQGAAAEMVTMITIYAADRYSLPVSTTHVLSSGVAGTMAANRSGLQMTTLRNVLLAWVLTLPVCVLLGAALFAAGLVIVLNNLTTVVSIVTGMGLIAFLAWRIASFLRKRGQPTVASPA